MSQLSHPPLSRNRALFELVFAAGGWGFGFVATRWALGSFTPLWISLLRFLLATTVGIALFWNRRPFSRIPHFGIAAAPGLFLGITLILQTYGLQSTTIAKSSFITCLYVVFVPIVEGLFLGRKIHLFHWFCVAVALVGASLITQLEVGGWSRGDLFTLGCALAAALQILAIDRVSTKIESAFAFNIWQSFWSLILPLAFIPFLEPNLPYQATGMAIAGLVFLAIGSTLIAFLIQIRGQKVITPSTISMVFLLESPFASLFAIWIFRETLTGKQWLGAFLIFLAAALATQTERLTKKLR